MEMREGENEGKKCVWVCVWVCVRARERERAGEREGTGRIAELAGLPSLERARMAPIARVLGNAGAPSVQYTPHLETSQRGGSPGDAAAEPEALKGGGLWVLPSRAPKLAWQPREAPGSPGQAALGVRLQRHTSHSAIPCAGILLLGGGALCSGMGMAATGLWPASIHPPVHLPLPSAWPRAHACGLWAAGNRLCPMACRCRGPSTAIEKNEKNAGG